MTLSFAQHNNDSITANKEKINLLKKELIELDLLYNFPEKNSTESDTKIDSFNTGSKDYIAKLVSEYPNVSAKGKKDLEFLKSQLNKVYEIDSKTAINQGIPKNETEGFDSLGTSSVLSEEISGVYFRIQIFAAEVSSLGTKFSNDLGIKEEIYEEFDNGLYKYLIGKFPNYNSAKSKSTEINSLNGIDSFVVCYINGKRTTITDILID